MKRIVARAFIVLFVYIGLTVGAANKLKTENVFLIMSDGLRWQEVFGGADESIINLQHGGVPNTNALRETFWRKIPEERRAALLPFFWTEIARRGQLFGNTNKGSIAHIMNSRKFSYPGFNEVLTGADDPRINTNDKRPNPNVTVFEWMQGRPGFTGQIGVFGGWDVFPYIFNVERSGLPIWPAWEPKFDRQKIVVAKKVDLLARDTTPISHGVVMDAFLFHAARNYIKEKQPRLLFLSFEETDTWAHAKRYDLYLASAHNVDRFIKELWEIVQAMPQYRDKTTLIITCDHGRGATEANWKDHGAWIPGAENIWMAVIGPDTSPLGERKDVSIGQNQIAATVAALLGENFNVAFPSAGPPIQDVIRR